MRTPLILGLLVLVCTAVCQPLPAGMGNSISAAQTFPTAPDSSTASVSKLPIRSLLYPGATTVIFVRWMPWFGAKGHIDVGYRSDDPAQVNRQVEDMQSRGIDGAIVDWYGPTGDLKDHATQRLFEAAEHHPGFKVAISVDSGSLKNCTGSCDRTQLLIDELTYVTQKMAVSPSYARFNGQPLITFFGLEKSDIEWHRVRQKTPGNPLLVFRNSGAFRQPESDGGFSWIAPETVTPDDPLGFRYIDRFHETAAREGGRFVMGSVYKGFDDRLAGWGKGRHIDERCGQTWLDSFAELNKFYSQRHQLPALIIVTWNDHEEGTEIETGIDNCLHPELRLDGARLAWTLNGPMRTVDHLEIVEESPAGLRIFAKLEPGQTSLDLQSLHLPPGDHHLALRAIGKPSIRNHDSNAVVYRAPGGNLFKP